MAQLELLLIQPQPATVATLADVVLRLQADQHLSLRRRGDLISALRTVERLADTPLSSIPATPVALRACFDRISHVAVGMSDGRWNNIRSLSMAALTYVGVRTLTRRTRLLLDDTWDDLRNRLPDAGCRAGLSRFMSYCSASGIAPEHVTPAVMEQFGQALHDDSIAPNPRQTYRTACMLWNQAVVEIPGWPSVVVPVPDRSRRYAMHWEEFPTGFRDDAEAFLNRLADQDPFADDYAPPVRPSTVVMRRKQILQIATAAVRSGLPVEQVTGLAVLVQPDIARQALRFFLKRAGDKATKYLHQQAILLKTIARHWAGASREHIDVLAGYAHNLAVKKTGMTEKNRDRLRQFDSVENVADLVGLGANIFKEVGKCKEVGRRQALRVMLAFAVTLLLTAPMRIKNLAGLDLDQHFVKVRSGDTSSLHLVIRDVETKNSLPYELKVQSVTVELLAIYCEKYRPLLADAENRWLFPNPDGERRREMAFATSIKAFIKRETGLVVNVHLFRHIAGKLYLEENPADIETVRRVLGHSSTATTLRAYVDVQTASAFRRYDEVIASLQQQAKAAVRPKLRSRARMPA